MIDHHAVAAGFSRRFLVAAGIILLAFIIAVAAVPGVPRRPRWQHNPAATQPNR